ncbi:hypothetical protein [Virgibacillus sp. JSM 102003]|uniref:hypothetical protein n=1 Tax=Virgibacillus sp. JSM 102003 TaxID=1562108 RepID=UPI0035C131DD
MDEFTRKNNVEDDLNKEEQPETRNMDMVGTNLSGQPPHTTDEPEASAADSKRYDEEFAAEMTADDIGDTVRNDETKEGAQANSAFGWVALALSIISFFIMPIILGGAGIIVGFISRNRDAETLGNTAIIAGAASILITLFVLPYV